MADLNGGVPPIPHRTSANGGSGFIDVDTLKDANGLIAIISQRRANGVMTFGIFKEFERDGRMERTSFIPEVLIPAFNDIAKLAQDRIAKIHADGLEPIKIPPRSSRP